ncbi:MAG: septum formation inhibitor Maf [Myxococcales bacterium]|nr:MAG: septum formation inhibitor Maf [Myxococcales bacterium]
MIILASQSPRRRQLLEAVGMQFAVRPVDIDERSRPGESPAAFVLRLSREKAEAALRQNGIPNGELILAADTTVVLDGAMLGKPENRDDARRMLSALSGRTHEVYTGVCILDARGRAFAKAVRTPVAFRRLPPEEIESYLDTDEPYDKAGAYAIQGRGVALIDRVEGSFTNVIGLPLAETLALLEAARGEP